MLDRRRLTNTVMTSLTAACAFSVVGILAIILGYIAFQGISSLNWEFLIETPKPVGEGGGIGNAIVGSLILLALASVIGIPFGVAVGTFLSEFGDGWFGSIVRFVADTMIGIPSIVFGVFVYALVVLRQGYFSTLAGSLALALIMIPIVSRTTEEMVRLVPTAMREGALALGAPRWRVTTDIVLPAARAGIATGAMLAVARVLGETAPLLFTAFGSRFYNFYLDEPMASLTVQIYNYAISPFDEWHEKAWAATLVLLAMILGINIAVRFFTRKRF
ncbi:MAG: phosphate ABC transporter permease PstA [Pyrinomonadaceae bacterium]|jgi:phosphate transport system permease protein